MFSLEGGLRIPVLDVVEFEVSRLVILIDYSIKRWDDIHHAEVAANIVLGSDVGERRR